MRTVPTVNPSEHGFLRGLLLVFSIFASVASILLLFQTRFFILVVPLWGTEPLETMLVLILRAFALIGIGVAWLLFVASRDPVRYRAVIDFFIGVLILLALLDIDAGVELQETLGSCQWFSFGRAALRLAIAVLLIALRPKVSPL